jgi:DNA-binding transcriptional MerR regulator
MTVGTTARKTICKVAQETGLSVHTLRYYERIGLIPPVQRAKSGHRQYSDEDVAWFRFLQKLRATGMPICQVREYVALQQRGNETLRERFKLLQAHRDTLAERIRELSRMYEFIDAKVGHYAEIVDGKRGEDCP